MVIWSTFYKTVFHVQLNIWMYISLCKFCRKFYEAKWTHRSAFHNVIVLNEKVQNDAQKTWNVADVLSLRNLLSNLMNVFIAFSFIRVETNEVFTHKYRKTSQSAWVLVQDCTFSVWYSILWLWDLFFTITDVHMFMNLPTNIKCAIFCTQVLFPVKKKHLSLNNTTKDEGNTQINM